MKWLNNLFTKRTMLSTETDKATEPLTYLVRKEMIIELQEQTFRHCSARTVGEITAWALMLSELGDDALVAVWEIECG